MKVLSTAVYVLAGILTLFCLIDTFIVWIELWDVAGAVFSALVLPLAFIAHPIGRAMSTGNWVDIVAGYFRIGVMFGLWYLGVYLSEKAEERKQEKEYAKRYIESLSAPTKSAKDVGNYVGSVDSSTYHCLQCPHAQRISSVKLVYFNSAAEAHARGYSPCQWCKPPQ